MDWNRLREQWRREQAVLAPTSLEALREPDRKQRRRVHRRDRTETIGAVLGGGVLLYVSIDLALHGNWPAFGFGMLLVAYAVAVPLILRNARGKVPEPAPELPLRQRLAKQRDAALVQADLLERAWLWYVLPMVVGVIGLVVSLAGISTFAWASTAGVLAFGALLVWINRLAGRQFRAHARQLQRQIDGPGGDTPT